MVYNPVNREVSTTLSLPLYYSGLTDKAIIREKDGQSGEYELDRAHDVNCTDAQHLTDESYVKSNASEREFDSILARSMKLPEYGPQTDFRRQ